MTNVSLLQIASIIAIFQALLMAVFLFFNKRNGGASNVILASMLLVFAVLSGCSLYLNLFQPKISSHDHKILFVLGHLAFSIGPLLYFYIKSLLGIKFAVRMKDCIHFLPLAAAVVSSFFIVLPYKHFSIWTYPGRIYFSGAVLAQNLAYFLASWKILQAHGLTVRSFLSYIDNSKLAWLRFFVCGYVVLWCIQLQLFVGWDVLQRPTWCPYATSLYFLTAFLFFNGMVYFGLRRPEMFRQSQKYQNSVLKDSDKEEYQQRLLSLMNSEKLYLKSSISLPEVAGRLEIAPCYVSQIINESFRQNFHDFVNRYRIEESKRLLTRHDQNLNIMGIALDAGFNSKSAFNSAFKRHTGITPKEFKKRESRVVL